MEMYLKKSARVWLHQANLPRSDRYFFAASLDTGSSSIFSVNRSKLGGVSVAFKSFIAGIWRDPTCDFHPYLGLQHFLNVLWSFKPMVLSSLSHQDTPDGISFYMVLWVCLKMGSRHNTWSIVVLKGMLFLGAIFSNKPLSSQKNSIFTKHGNFEEFWSFFWDHHPIFPFGCCIFSWWSSQKDHRGDLDHFWQPRSHFRSHLISLLLNLRRRWNKLRKLKKDGAKVTPCGCWCVFLETGDSIHIFYQLNVINPKITDQNIGLSKANI